MRKNNQKPNQGSKKNPTLYRTLQGHNTTIKSIDFNCETTQMISCGEDSLLYLWNLKKKNIRAKKLKGHAAAITEVAFSPSAALIATASMDNTVRIWSNRSLDNYPSNVIRSHNACVRSVAFSPDSRFVVTGSNDKTVKIFNAKTRKFRRSYNEHTNWVTSVRFSLDGTQLASSSSDKSMLLYDVETSDALHRFLDHTASINAVRFLPGNNCLASCSDDKTIKIYDLRSNQLLQHYNAHSGSVNQIDFHPSGFYMVSASNDSKVKIWDLRKGEPLFSLYGHTGATHCVKFSDKGDYFSSGGIDKMLLVWKSGFTESKTEEKKAIRRKKRFVGGRSLVFQSKVTKEGTLRREEELEKEAQGLPVNYDRTDVRESFGVDSVPVNVETINSNLLGVTKMTGEGDLTVGRTEEKRTLVIEADDRINGTLDMILTQIDKICTNLKSLNTRIEENENDVTKLANYLKNDASQISPAIQDPAAVYRRVAERTAGGSEVRAVRLN